MPPVPHYEPERERPKYIGVCPEPSHMDDFYMSLDEPHGRCPYDCPHDLIIYVPMDRVISYRAPVHREEGKG